MTKTEQSERGRYTGSEWRALKTARKHQKPVTFIDDDGCEVTVTPDGHVLFNASDWR